jgi:hypothetical protein
MPAGGKTDRCVDAIEKGYLEKGKSKKSASAIAWAVCKQQERDRAKEAAKKKKAKEAK